MSGSPHRKATILGNLARYRQLYLMLLPGLLFFLVYRYLPLYGLTIAFKEYLPWVGVLKSKWVGIEHFLRIFSGRSFPRVLGNSLIISALKIAVGFPAPIVFALLLNQVRGELFKKSVQTITYLPYFLSWVIIYGLIYNLGNASYGLVNSLIRSLGGETVAFLAEPRLFRPLIVATDVWKSLGWNTIIYLAALAGIDQELYAAAQIDGANRWQQVRYITLPCILPIAAILLLLRIGSILYNDFEQLLLFLGSNPLLTARGEILETYVYRVGILQGQWSLGAAMGFFQSVFGLLLVILSNRLARFLGYRGLW